MTIIATSFRRRVFVGLMLAGFLASAVGCASGKGASGAEASAASQDASEQARPTEKKDAFEVARAWAASVPGAEVPSPELHSITASWRAAQVARVWAAGDEYRALIIEKSTTGERPAVLLYLSSDTRGEWQIEAIKPSTSTALWSQF